MLFRSLQGKAVEVGMAIVNHPSIKAIGFTGSFKAGKAIFDAAARRGEPIPVYAEMGSANPVFVLPGALRENGETIAQGLAGSVALGVGQFCTNPGIVVLPDDAESRRFQLKLARSINETAAGVMLTAGIFEAYKNGISALAALDAVETLSAAAPEFSTRATAAVLRTNAAYFLSDKKLEEEIFGPSTLIVTANEKAELLAVAARLGGHLTATVFGSEADLKNYRELLDLLEQKVGRLIINGFPTGVEVCDAMIHGGMFPATTDSRTTSVGTAAIYRFTRPVCYQNFPDFLLPDELKTGNPLGIWRKIDGDFKKEQER